MTREIRRAIALLELLEEYLVVTGLCEDYYRSAINRDLTPLEDRATHAGIQKDYMIPLMEECRKQGFHYSDLMGIIVPAFRTNRGQRRELLDSLEDWAQEQYEFELPLVDA